MENLTRPLEDRQAALERSFIAEFLESRGHTRQSAATLPEAETERLLKAAAEHASLRLAEIESRAHYVDGIHRPA